VLQVLLGHKELLELFNNVPFMLHTAFRKYKVQYSLFAEKLIWQHMMLQ
jgi:hypothetical protein